MVCFYASNRLRSEVKPAKSVLFASNVALCRSECESRREEEELSERKFISKRRMIRALLSVVNELGLGGRDPRCWLESIMSCR